MNTRAVVMLIEYQGRVLLGKKAEVAGHPLSGQWHIPGGRIEPAEDETAAIKREALEETGIEVEPVKLLTVSNYYGHRLLWYICRPVESLNNLRAVDDLAEVEFVKISEVENRCSMAAKAAWPPAIYQHLSGHPPVP